MSTVLISLILMVALKGENSGGIFLASQPGFSMIRAVITSRGLYPLKFGKDGSQVGKPSSIPFYGQIFRKFYEMPFHRVLNP